MNKLKTNRARVLVAMFVILAFGLFLGCSSEQTAKTEEMVDKAAEKTEQLAGAVDQARELKVAISNPDPKVCPVCGMDVDHTMVITVADKNYAMCSESCVTMFKEDPQKYLAAAAKKMTGHEGHDHD